MGNTFWNSARAFAKALYRAIEKIETGRPSRRVVKIAARAEVGNLRAIADIAVAANRQKIPSDQMMKEEYSSGPKGPDEW